MYSCYSSLRLDPAHYRTPMQRKYVLHLAYWAHFFLEPETCHPYALALRQWYSHQHL